MLAYPIDTPWLSTITKAGRTSGHLVSSDSFYSRGPPIADTVQARQKNHKILINITPQAFRYIRQAW